MKYTLTLTLFIIIKEFKKIQMKGGKDIAQSGTDDTATSFIQIILRMNII